MLAAGKVEEPPRQLQRLKRRPLQSLAPQEGLTRAHSAPPSTGAVAAPLSISEALQPSAQTHRDAPQQAHLCVSATVMVPSSSPSRKAGRNLQKARQPKPLSTADRDAWCSTFRPSKQLPAGQNLRGSSKQAASSSLHRQFPEHLEDSGVQSYPDSGGCMSKAAEGEGDPFAPNSTAGADNMKTEPAEALWCLSRKGDMMSSPPFLNLGEVYLPLALLFACSLWTLLAMCLAAALQQATDIAGEGSSRNTLSSSEPY